MALADWAAEWADAPVLKDQPGVIAITDQYAAGLMDSWDTAGMSESERVTFGLGVLAMARWVHHQLIEWDIHDDEGPAFLCESTGLISSTVARKATGG